MSTDHLVYQLERARLSPRRMEALVEFRSVGGRNPAAVARFVASLIRASAAQTSGTGAFALPAFWAAVAGIAVIGVLNLTVSFALAMWVAIRSTGRCAVSRRRLVRAVLAHLRAATRNFRLPPRVVR